MTYFNCILLPLCGWIAMNVILEICPVYGREEDFSIDKEANDLKSVKKKIAVEQLNRVTTGK